MVLKVGTTESLSKRWPASRVLVAQIEGFAEYGFPESHAAAFAMLTYVSSWLKCHHPAIFACALLNSQPMGFYAPAQIVRDAREHQVEVRPICVNNSAWDNHLERRGDGSLAIRLGFRQIKGFRAEDAGWIVAARGNGYPDPESLWLRAGLAPSVLERLAEADAFADMGLTRRDALWAVRAIDQGLKKSNSLRILSLNHRLIGQHDVLVAYRRANHFERLRIAVCHRHRQRVAKLYRHYPGAFGVSDIGVSLLHTFLPNNQSKLVQIRLNVI